MKHFFIILMSALVFSSCGLEYNQESINKEITLRIFPAHAGFNANFEMTVSGMGEHVVLSDDYDDMTMFYIIAQSQGFYSKQYSCKNGETIDVMLEKHPEDGQHGAAFVHDYSSIESLSRDLIINETSDYADPYFSFDGECDDACSFTVPFENEDKWVGYTDDEGNVFYCERYFSLMDVDTSGNYRDVFFTVSESCEDKPNIYLYPEETTEIVVKIDFPNGGKITKSIPEYGDGWQVTATPEGVIDDEYGFLFYESVTPKFFQKQYGWVVAKEDLEHFFRENLYETGFRGREINDFIEWWVPRLNDAPFYALYPQFKREIDPFVRLHFSKNPDTIIRLFYVMYPLLDSNDMQPERPRIPYVERTGFVVAEWGVVVEKP